MNNQTKDNKQLQLDSLTAKSYRKVEEEKTTTN
jgi:hypothetical protein